MKNNTSTLWYTVVFGVTFFTLFKNLLNTGIFFASFPSVHLYVFFLPKTDHEGIQILNKKLEKQPLQKFSNQILYEQCHYNSAKEFIIDNFSNIHYIYFHILY